MAQYPEPAIVMIDVDQYTLQDALEVDAEVDLTAVGHDGFVSAAYVNFDDLLVLNNMSKVVHSFSDKNTRAYIVCRDRAIAVDRLINIYLEKDYDDINFIDEAFLMGGSLLKSFVASPLIPSDLEHSIKCSFEGCGETLSDFDAEHLISYAMKIGWIKRDYGKHYTGILCPDCNERLD